MLSWLKRPEDDTSHPVGVRHAHKGRHRRGGALALAVVLGATTFAFAHLASGEIEGDVFRSDQWGVEITAPRNWQLTGNTAYPSVLLRMVRAAPDGIMLLTAERVAPNLTARAYADATLKIIGKMNFRTRAPQLHSSTGAFIVDSHRGESFLRQAFLVHGGIGYSLTLSAPSSRGRSQHLRAFDSALRSIQTSSKAVAPAPATPTDQPTDQPNDRTESSPPPSTP